MDSGHETKEKALLSFVVGDEEAALGQLKGKVLNEIVDRLPIKSLAEMKLVSKGWRRLISDRLRSISQRTSSTLLPGIHPGIPPSSSSMMEQKAPQHDELERKRIRLQAILKRCFPESLLTDGGSLNPSSNESNADGVCKWCLQKFNHTNRDDCPAGDLTFEPISFRGTKVLPPPTPPITKENSTRGEVKIYFPDEVDDADVKKLFETFGDLHRVKLYKIKAHDGFLCYAIVRFVNLDDAEKAVEKLKEQGYSIRWYE